MCDWRLAVLRHNKIMVINMPQMHHSIQNESIYRETITITRCNLLILRGWAGSIGPFASCPPLAGRFHRGGLVLRYARSPKMLSRRDTACCCCRRHMVRPKARGLCVFWWWWGCIQYHGALILHNITFTLNWKHVVDSVLDGLVDLLFVLLNQINDEMVES